MPFHVQCTSAETVPKFHENVTILNGYAYILIKIKYHLLAVFNTRNHNQNILIKLAYAKEYESAGIFNRTKRTVIRFMD